MEGYIKNYEKWLASSALNDAEKAELEAIGGDRKEIEERFAKGLSFGTAGLRGVMKTGWNAMNVHTVAHATPGTCESHTVREPSRRRCCDCV